MTSPETLYSSIFQPFIKKISKENIFNNFNKSLHNLILKCSQLCPIVDNVKKFV